MSLHRRVIGSVVLAVSLLRGSAGLAVDLQARLQQLNQREKQLIEKLEGLQQRERDVQEKLDEIRVLKQAILNKIGVQKPGAAGSPPPPTPAATP